MTSLDAKHKQKPNAHRDNGLHEPLQHTDDATSEPSYWECKSYWQHPASKALRKHVNEDAWIHYMEGRTVSSPFGPLDPGEGSPLGWGVCRDQLSRTTCRLLEAVDAHSERRKGRRKSSRAIATRALKKGKLVELLLEWSETADDVVRTIDFALSCLATAHLLSSLATRIKTKTWWNLLSALRQISEEADTWTIDASVEAESAAAQQLLAGELPFTLSFLFPEMKPLHALRPAARLRLSEGLVELTNGEGLVHGRQIGLFPVFFACWTRCRLIGARTNKKPWSGEAATQYSWMVRQVLMWTGPHGSPLLSEPLAASEWSAPFLRACLEIAGDGSDIAAARAVFGRRVIGKGLSRSDYDPPHAADCCEWSGLAVLRSDWSPEASVVAVCYQGTEVKVEAAIGNAVAVRGAWTSTTLVDGVEVVPSGDWEEVCWVSDEDVDYLELSVDMGPGVHLDRQILLARRDGILWLADVVRSAAGRSVKHTWRLPLASRVQFVGAEETRDALLRVASNAVPAKERAGGNGKNSKVAKKTAAALLPLGLNEWRSDPRGGELECRDGHLQIWQEGEGSSLACPLFWDLRPQRSESQLTWRQLTVAQSLEILPRHAAAGFRAQCGHQQWLFYRALASQGNRTLLGQNTSGEFFAARFFATTGEAETLVEIEG